MTSKIETLFNRLTNGLAILNSEGHVKFANEELKSMLPIDLGKIFPSSPVRIAIQDAIAGHLSLPHTLELIIEGGKTDSAAEQADAHILWSPVSREIIVLIQRVTIQNTHETIVENLFNLFEMGLVKPLEDFITKLQAFVGRKRQMLEKDDRLPDTLTSVQYFFQEGDAIVSQLRQLSLLAKAGKCNRVNSRDRIMINEVLPIILNKMDKRAASLNKVLLSELSFLPGTVVYGNQYWLTLAIESCLDHSLKYAPLGTSITVTVRQDPTFVSIIISSKGESPRRSHLIKKQKDAPVFLANVGNSEAVYLGLELPLAKGIIEQHKGNLLLKQDLDGFLMCFIELPTGGERCEEDLLVSLELRARRFADDSTRLRCHNKRKSMQSPLDDQSLII